MEFASEMVALALRHGLRVAEIPITYYPRGGESKLRSFRDGWRHLRFMLLLSPTPLFLVPGLAAVLLGLGALFALLPGPLRIGGFAFDYHFMFVASALAVLGVQLVVLGLAAKSYARGELSIRGDWWLTWLDRHFTLERGLLVGLGLVAAGLGINAWILVLVARCGPRSVVRGAARAAGSQLDRGRCAGRVRLVLHQRAARRSAPVSAAHRVSAVIPTLNGAATLPALLAALGRERAAGRALVEIVAIDSGSRDGTRDLLRKAGARVLDLGGARFAHGGARNRAAAAAEGDVLLFLTQDVEPVGDDWLPPLLEPFSDGRVAGVFGRQVPRDASPEEAFLAKVNYAGRERRLTAADLSGPFGPGTTLFSNAFGAVRRVGLGDVSRSPTS